jgi:hypothetical protein
MRGQALILSVAVPLGVLGSPAEAQTVGQLKRELAAKKASKLA